MMQLLQFYLTLYIQQQMEQGMPAGPPEGMPPGMDQGMPTDAAMQMQAPVMAAARYGGTPRYQLQGETPPPTNFSQAFENQSMLDNNVDDIVDEGALGGVGIDPSTNLELLGQLQPRSFQESRS